ncbi:MAG TPA: sulfatase-like hydrolase/transferase [Opitutaceae bacterium]|nr:sulfatase-like hydrolase/transferase [Opitutaceae bacterium]
MPKQSRPNRPNVLLIVADDHQAGAIGALGHPVVRTPTLDGLVARGTAFTRAYYMGGLVPALCAPARAALLTGTHLFSAQAAPELHPARHDVAIDPARPTLPELFRRAGYETFVTGKWHNDGAALRRSFSRGERIFLGGMCDHRRVPLHDYAPARAFPSARVRFERGFSTELFCDAARRFVARRAADPRPFFAYVALTSPHDPRTPPAAYARQYRPAKLPLPGNFLPEHPFDNGEMGVRDERLASHPLRPAAVRRHLADYYGMISHHDAEIGRLLDTIARTGQAENTIVAYVSDHGLALGGHGLLGKQNLYEHSVRVPLLLSGPGVRAGGRDAELAYSFDLFPTLCDLAAVDCPRDILGRSLVPRLRRPGRSGRESVFALYRDCQRMVADRRWKLIQYDVGGRKRLQLFDLESDPGETRDLSGLARHRPRVARLRRRLDEWQNDVGDRWMREFPE